MSAVKVMNVKTGTVMIEDISIDVPQGVMVEIPAEKAHRSKDLWRLISQRLLFRFHGGPIHGATPFPASIPADPPDAQTVRYHEMVPNDPQQGVLEEQNRLLRQALQEREQAFTAAIATHQGQITELLGVMRELTSKISSNVVVTGAPCAPSAGASPPRTQGVSGAAPIFIPSAIKPENVEGQITVQTEAQDSSSVSAAASALRRIREKKGEG